MNTDILMKCYCKSREMTSYYSNLLNNDSLNNMEKDIIYDLLLNNVNASVTIKKIFDHTDETESMLEKNCSS
ncbi:hypothetical protein [Oceanobacillus locisalsi]|uniref:Uncharacterized protein n=1 Tax=Oceanobacillus locisalsi TaxID=546107 RepID=A0ABW3NAK9_9BACI